MSKRVFALLAFLLPFAFSCTRESVSVQPAEPKVETVSTYVPGVAVIKLSEDAQAQIAESGGDVAIIETKGGRLAAVLSELGVVSIKRILPDAGRFEARTREMGLHRWYEIHYTSSLPSTKAAGNYASIPEIEFFEPEVRVKPTGFFDDPLLDRQWHYVSDGGKGKAGADVDVLPVWEEYTTGSSEVVVCVVDGGIDYAHLDLNGQVILNDSYNFINGNRAISAHGHGTHVAGTIAAINNNGLGVCGIAGGDAKAGNPGVRLLSCQVFAVNPADPEHDFSASSTNFASAIKWGADHGAVISSNSWGNVYDTEEAAKADGVSNFFKECVEYFNTYAGIDENGDQVGPMAGGLVVFAAGNDNWQYAHPSDYEGVMAVGAIDATGGRAPYSNYGSWVDICAPGGSYSNQLVWSTIPDNSYAGYQGTSMACPHVSGVAALVVSACGGPGFTRAMLIEKLLEGAKKGFVPAYANIGNLVSAYGAVAYGQDMSPEAVSSFELSTASNNVTFNWKTGVASNGKKAYGYQVMLAGGEDAFAGLDPHNFPSTIKSARIAVRDLSAGANVSATISGLEFSTDYFACIVGYDVNGNYSALSPIKKVTTSINHAPTISFTFTQTELHSFEIVRIPITITDQDGHSFTHSLEGASEFVYLKTNTAGDEFIVIEAPKAEAGQYEVSLIAEDQYGAVSREDITFTILSNNAPRVVQTVENIIFDGKGKKQQLDLAAVFTDDDGEPLTFKVNISSGGVLHSTVAGTELSLTALSLGTVSVTISANDAKGEVAEVTFQVLVRDSSEEIQTFPNPVKDKLGIRLRDAATVSVSISNRAGAVVFSASGVEIDPFNPFYVDMKSFPGGVYYVKVSGSGEDRILTIAKR